MRMPFLSPGRRKWRCLSPEELAFYADGGSSGFQRVRVERHLTSCRACRESLAVVLKSASADPAGVPSSAIARVRHLGHQAPRANPRWAWAVAGALACVLAGWGIIRMIEHPKAQATAVAANRAPTPVSSSAPADRGNQDQVRKLETARAAAPVVVLPAADAKVTPDVEVRWQPLPGTVAYDVRILNAAGDLVWSG